MPREEIDVIAVKNSHPDLVGEDLPLFFELFGEPRAHGVGTERYSGFEAYRWSGCGGDVAYIFDRDNICISDDFDEFFKLF